LKKRLIIVGGGAAGIFCAINAARMCEELEVVVIEKTDKLLSKVKISGGGRCNVTHACFSISDLVKKYPRGGNFLKKEFRLFNTTDTIEWFESRDVKLKTEADGRIFPESNSSQTIIDCFLREANKQKVTILLHKNLIDIEIFEETEKQKRFNLKLYDGEVLTADYLCLACGGFSKFSQFEMLKNSGHTVVEPVPSLFTFNIQNDLLNDLAGISLSDLVVKIAGTKLVERGAALITHWGLSGPAVLRLSAWGAQEFFKKDYESLIFINWVPQFNESQLRENWANFRKELATIKIKNKNPFSLPQRLWDYLIEISGIKPDCKWSELPAKEQNKLIINLCSHELNVSGKTTFKEEFVTAGGVDVSEINPSTMESKLIPHLYFAGEIMNIDGITGGFNFQHAWSSGFIVAKSITEGLKQIIFISEQNM